MPSLCPRPQCCRTVRLAGRRSSFDSLGSHQTPCVRGDLIDEDSFAFVSGLVYCVESSAEVFECGGIFTGHDNLCAREAVTRCVSAGGVFAVLERHHGHCAHGSPRWLHLDFRSRCLPFANSDSHDPLRPVTKSFGVDRDEVAPKMPVPLSTTAVQSGLIEQAKNPAGRHRTGCSAVDVIDSPRPRNLFTGVGGAALRRPRSQSRCVVLPLISLAGRSDEPPTSGRCVSLLWRIHRERR